MKGENKLNVILWSTGCPNCDVLKKKLDSKKVQYIINNDKDEMIRKGFMSVPILEIDNKCMSYKEAIKWLEGQD